MLAAQGLFQLEALPATAFNKALLLPHLAMLSRLSSDPVLDSSFGRALWPGVLITHAILILLASLVAATGAHRAERATWAPWLALFLGCVAFYVACFSFVHPNPLSAQAGPALRALDFLAVVAGGFGAWAALRFVGVFPMPFEAAGYIAFSREHARREHAEVSASRFALRERAMVARATFVLRLQSRFAAAALAVGGIVAMGLITVGAGRAGTTAQTILTLAGVGGLALLWFVIYAAAGSILHFRSGAGDALERRATLRLVRPLVIELWVLVVVAIAAHVVGLVTGSWRVLVHAMLALPLGLLLIALTGLVAILWATWNAPDRAGPAT
jgi:hypothetical protein